MKSEPIDRKLVLRKHDALDLLTRDHDVIKQLFWDYQRMMKRQEDNERKAEVIGLLCFRLTIHRQIEEEIFYPAARAVILPAPLTEMEGQTLIGMAIRDHLDEKLLIARLDEMEPEDDGFDATVVELSTSVGPHMYEEEQYLFPKIRKSGIDTAALGLQMAQHRRALYADVTRVNVTRATNSADISGWPVACPVNRSDEASTSFSWQER